MNIDFSADIRAATRDLSNLQREQIPKAAARTLNKLAAAGKKEAIRSIRAEVGESARGGLALSKALFVQRASWKSLTAYLVVTRRKIPLIYFKPKQTSAGVTAKVGETQVTIPSGFIKRIYGSRSVWIRKHRGKGSTAKTPRGPLRGRFPVKKVMGPSVAVLFLQSRVLSHVERVVRDRFPKQFRDEMEFYLKFRR